MEEYTATYDDDDIKFVGTLNEATGRFTPNIDGPNRQRSGERNNIGDVWVVAKCSATPRRQAGDDAAGRAHLLVTVPLYMRFDPTVGPMSHASRLREFHTFEAAGRRFVYMVPSAAVFAFDDCSAAVVDSLASGPRAGRRPHRASWRRASTPARSGTRSPSCTRVRAIGEATRQPRRRRR